MANATSLHHIASAKATQLSDLMGGVVKFSDGKGGEVNLFVEERCADALELVFKAMYDRAQDIPTIDLEAAYCAAEAAIDMLGEALRDIDERASPYLPQPF